MRTNYRLIMDGDFTQDIDNIFTFKCEDEELKKQVLNKNIIDIDHKLPCRKSKNSQENNIFWVHNIETFH